MSDPASNPYASPQSEILPVNQQRGNPASPWIRLVSQIIDGLILLPLNFVLTRLLFTVDQAAVNAAAAAGDVAGAMKAATPPFHLVILSSLIGIAALIAINWKFLPHGQTIGKKIMKTQIQARDGSLLPVKTLITRRMLPLYLAASIPMIGPLLLLIDALCIFRPGRNTLHDDLAGSKVIVL